tara:strand:- start:2546 stop:3700 length:1155 start_codon:yes stop_codon:yes gene_type:complete
MGVKVENQSWEQLLQTMRTYLKGCDQRSSEISDIVVEGDLLNLAKRHRVSGLVGAALGSGVSSELDQATVNYQMRSLKLAAHLLDLTKAFDASEFRLIALKGVTLSKQLYPSLGLRYVGDIDIWIAESDVEKAHALMQEMGYRDDCYNPLSPYYRKHYRRLRHHITYTNPEKRSSVELHWSLMSHEAGCPLEFETAFDRGRDVSLGSQSVRVLSRDDEWLYLHAHAARHLWQRLQWLMDLAIIQQRHTTEEAEQLLIRASELGVQNSVACGMRLVHDALGVAAPESVLSESAADSKWRQLFAMGTNYLNENGQSQEFVPTSRDMWKAQWAMNRSASSRWHYVEMIFLNPDDWGRIKLPDRCIWLYFPVRIWFWIRRMFSDHRSV